MDRINNRMQQMNLGRNVGRPLIIDGLSGVYSFDIKPEQKVFRYDVDMARVFTRNNNEDRERLTVRGPDDAKREVYRTICSGAIEVIYCNGGFNGNGHGQIQYVYDGCKNLFTNMEAVFQKKYELRLEDLPQRSQSVMGHGSLVVQIQPCQTSQNVIDISDVKMCLQSSAYGNLEAPDHTIPSFLELLTNQPFLTAGTHTMMGGGLLFANVPHKTLQDGVALHRGISKGVRIIENNGTPTFALVVDVKTCAFYNPTTVEELYTSMMQDPRYSRDPDVLGKFVSYLKGVRFHLTYNRSRSFKFGSVTQRNAREVTIGEGDRTIEAYYRDMRNITINNPDLPLVRIEGDTRDTMFPMQCCQILPLQRISVEKMSDVLSRELLKENTTVPKNRYEAIDETARTIGFPDGQSGQFMRQFGVLLVGGSNSVSIRILNPPSIRFGNKETKPKNGRFDERDYTYHRCADLLRSFIVGYPRRINVQDVNNFLSRLLETATRKGLRLPTPELMIIELDQLPGRMEELSREQKQFLMYIDSKYVKSHGILKLCERTSTLLTQHISIEVIQKGGAATITNILNKLHMKIAFGQGLNYLPVMENASDYFDLEKGHILVIGLDTSIPTPSAFESRQLKLQGIDACSKEPTVVGISANYVEECSSFAGTYFYQPAKPVDIDPESLQKAAYWVLQMLQRNKRQPPELIFLIRKGLSDGQIPNAVRSEFSAIREACLQAGINPKYVFTCVSKKHNKRFFTGRVENPAPSSVIDSKVVRPDIQEFYMQSHLPLKGTGQVAQYTFPINEVNADNQTLQGFLNSLCHNWQIVNLATSLPAPVQHALELAKRGKNNYIEMKRNGPDGVQRTENGLVDCDKLNASLSYAGGFVFGRTRFNA